MDLAIVVRARVPWYPPSNRPPKAVIAMVDEAPHNSAMVYQSHQADMYLEGNVAQTLRDLADAATVDRAVVEARRKDLAAAHDALVEKTSAAQAASRKKTPIDPVWVCASLNAVMPKDTIYIDEVTTHTATLRQCLQDSSSDLDRLNAKTMMRSRFFFHLVSPRCSSVAPTTPVVRISGIAVLKLKSRDNHPTAPAHVREQCGDGGGATAAGASRLDGIDHSDLLAAVRAQPHGWRYL